MKKAILLTSALLLFFAGTGKKCPVKGDSSNKKYQSVDSLKNRTVSGTSATVLSLTDVLKPGDDTKRYSSKDFVKITGYVFLVKFGGPETCNCHSSEADQKDIHIELVADMKTGSNEKSMIVEINRFTRAQDKSMDYDAVKQLSGKKVEVTGWLFFDAEHKQNAVNTRPNGTSLWRATCWEVHPCLFIKEVK